MATTAGSVLIVDDDPVVRHATMRSLAKVGFNCQPASDVRQALALLAQSPFDVVVSDLRMPGINGHTLATQVLALPERPVVVILTGVDEPRLTQDLMELGVDYIEYKPADYRVLTTRIQELAEARRYQLGVERASSAAATYLTEPRSQIEMTAATPAASPDLSAPEHGPALALDGNAVHQGSSSGAETSKAPAIIQEDHSQQDDHSEIDATLNLLNMLRARIEELDRTISHPPSTAATRFLQTPIVIFVAGAISGWLLSWLGPGGWLLR